MRHIMSEGSGIELLFLTTTVLRALLMRREIQRRKSTVLNERGGRDG